MKKVVVCSLICAFSLAYLFGIPLSPETAYAASAPQFKRMLPETITAGAPTFTIRIEGRRFDDGAQIVFDGSPLDTRVLNNGRLLLAEVPATAVASTSTHSVMASNSDGMSTQTHTLTVLQPH